MSSAVCGGFGVAFFRTGRLPSIASDSALSAARSVGGLNLSVCSAFTNSCPSSMLLKPRGNLLMYAKRGASKAGDLVVCEGSSLTEDFEDVVCVWSVVGKLEVSEVIA